MILITGRLINPVCQGKLVSSINSLIAYQRQGTHDVKIERFSKPNFGSIRRFRTMTGLEIEN